MLVLFDIDDTLIDHSAAVRDGVAVLYHQIRPFPAQWDPKLGIHVT